MGSAEAQVLERLDELAQSFTFSGFDNAHYTTVDARMHAFRNDDQWTLVIEELVHWPAADAIMQLATVIDRQRDELLTGAPVLPSRLLDGDGEPTHPNVYGEQAVSGSEAFQLMAKVLTTGDAAQWKPTEKPNNADWRFGLDESR